jgi:tRNA 2-thiouridine synthesizing protein A
LLRNLRKTEISPRHSRRFDIFYGTVNDQVTNLIREERGPETGKPSGSLETELDLRGDVCPITFVKSKLALEELESGALLRVIVDYRPSVKNVPASMENEGHRVLSVSEVQEGLWEILVKKA